MFERLSSANSRLDYAGLRLILAIDEFENIDTKIGEGIFSSDLLAAIRELIQSHRRLIWLFAGSHRVTMLKNAEWPSYLISVQTIEIPPFTEAETRLLLTDPLRQSPLYARDADVARVSMPAFGGKAVSRGSTPRPPDGLTSFSSSPAAPSTTPTNSETARLDGRALEEVAKRAIVSGDMVLHQLVPARASRTPSAPISPASAPKTASRPPTTKPHSSLSGTARSSRRTAASGGSRFL